MATFISSRDLVPKDSDRWCINYYLSRKDQVVTDGDWDDHIFDIQVSEIGNKRSLKGQPIHHYLIRGKDLRQWALEEAEEYRSKHKLPNNYSLHSILGISDSN